MKLLWVCELPETLYVHGKSPPIFVQKVITLLFSFHQNSKYLQNSLSAHQVSGVTEIEQQMFMMYFSYLLSRESWPFVETKLNRIVCRCRRSQNCLRKRKEQCIILTDDVSLPPSQINVSKYLKWWNLNQRSRWSFKKAYCIFYKSFTKYYLSTHYL